MGISIAGIAIPDSKMAREATDLVRSTESSLLFHHSMRVFLFGALVGARKKMNFDPELIYIGAMFHDMGLTKAYSSTSERFEVDSANAAQDFLRRFDIAEESIEIVWDAIALHTTPGIPRHKKSEVALVTAGVDMDVLGFGYSEVSPEDRELVIAAHPRGKGFKEGIIHAFNDGFKHKPASTFGTMNDDVLAYLDPNFKREDFCKIILDSAWSD